MSEILQLQSVSRHFSGLQALCDVSLSVNRGEVLGLIGPNGAGKTTLVNVVTGVTPANSGTVTMRIATLSSSACNLDSSSASLLRSASSRPR